MKVQLMKKILVSVLMVSVPFVALAGPGPSCPQGLISYWTFDNPANPVKDDFDANSGALVGRPNSVTGIVGNALSFSGSGADYTEVPNSPSLQITGNQMTIEAWVRPAIRIDNTYVRQTVLVRKGGCADGYLLDFLGSDLGNGVQFSATTADGWKMFLGQNRTWQPGRWYHLAGTYDGVRFRAYVDGIEEPASYVDETSSPLAIGTTTLRFGQNNDRDPSWPLAGTIDEVAIYGRALSAAEIADHYNAGLAGSGYCAALNPTDISITPTCASVATPVTISVTTNQSGVYYRYLINDTSYCDSGGTASWSVLKDWTTDRTATWTPASNGRKTVVVWVTDDTANICVGMIGASYEVGSSNCLDVKG